MKRMPYIVAHVESKIGLDFNHGRPPRGYEFIAIHPVYKTIIFRRIPLWRRVLGEAAA